jgi:hypothetical protein
VKLVESKLIWKTQPKIDSGFISKVIAYDVANEEEFPDDEMKNTSKSSLLWNQYQDQERKS